MKRLLDVSKARVGEVFVLQPQSGTSRNWHYARLKVIAREAAGLRVSVVGFDPHAGPPRYERPAIGRQAVIDPRSHNLTYMRGFGAWFKTHGGNDGKAAVL